MGVLFASAYSATYLCLRFLKATMLAVSTHAFLLLSPHIYVYVFSMYLCVPC